MVGSRPFDNLLLVWLYAACEAMKDLDQLYAELGMSYETPHDGSDK
jgi:hypothetical protein